MSLTNLDLFPLVVLTFPPRLDQACVELFIEEQRALLARRALHVNLYDAGAVTNMPDATSRKMLAEFTKESDAASTRYNLGSVLVLDNPIVRAGLTAIHWLAPPPTQFVVVSTREAAMNECVRMLARRDLVVPQRTKRSAR